MNLAKIRQKALSDQATLLSENTLIKQDEVTAEKQPDLVEKECSASDALVNKEVKAGTLTGSASDHYPSVSRRETDPLKIILAGRAAAGCGDEMSLSCGEHSDAGNSYEEILCFRVADETYGINIMEIKEIIKPREATEVPRSPSFIMGVVSLRGVIIPVLNMRDRLGLAPGSENSRERIIVVKHSQGFTGLLVDEVIQVFRIGKDGFEPAPAVLEGIDRDFVAGIGRTGSMMVILLNIASVADINLY